MKRIAIAGVWVLCPLLANAALLGNDIGQVTANVVNPLSLTKVKDPNFGTLLASGAERTVKLTTGGELTPVAAAAVGPGTGTVQAGEFSLSGTAGTDVSIDVQGGDVVSCSGGVTARVVMTVPSSNLGLEDYRVLVGATLTIPGGATGSVSCPFTLVASYQ